MYCTVFSGELQSAGDGSASAELIKIPTAAAESLKSSDRSGLWWGDYHDSLSAWLLATGHGEGSRSLPFVGDHQKRLVQSGCSCLVGCRAPWGQCHPMMTWCGEIKRSRSPLSSERKLNVCTPVIVGGVAEKAKGGFS